MSDYFFMNIMMCSGKINQIIFNVMQSFNEMRKMKAVSDIDYITTVSDTDYITTVSDIRRLYHNSDTEYRSTGVSQQ